MSGSQEMLDAHVRFELDRISGAGLARTVAEETSALFDWLRTVRVADVLPDPEATGQVAVGIVEAVRIDERSAELLAEAVVVTVAASAGALPGTDSGSVKVTPLDRYPAKGRATGGVRAQRFLRGEDRLVLAWVGVGPARAVGSGGQKVALPEPDERRDASGTPLSAPVTGIG